MRRLRGEALSAALVLGFGILGGHATPAAAQQMPTTASRPSHQESARRVPPDPAPQPEAPALPDGMTLEEVLERADQPKPAEYPDPVPDDKPRAFLLVEQLEYRIGDTASDQLGWEAQGWAGFDYDRLWVKLEGESVFDGTDEGESETDLLYSRLITPFWNLQAGFQYANGWEAGSYDDRWSAAFALQGISPGMIEVDASLYVSEHADVTAVIEAEYNIRITQRLVVQPRAELGFAAQDVDRRNLGAGMTDANLDLRLRYEILRELAPYIGIRSRLLVGETGNLAEEAGEDDDAFFYFAGVRLAF